MQTVTRRSFVTSVGAASVLPASAVLGAAQGTKPAKENAAATAGTATPDTSVADRPTYLFFNAAEVLFIEAACERLIPADESGTGALGAGVPNYLDKQLGGAWGAGERLYRSGPWAPGTPQQGYQLPFTPAELFRNCLRAIDRQLGAVNTPFHEMSPDQQDAYLKSFESGGHDLDGVPSAIFFDMLLAMSIEGFFADPAYGGNTAVANGVLSKVEMSCWRAACFTLPVWQSHSSASRQPGPNPVTLGSGMCPLCQSYALES